MSKRSRRSGSGRGFGKKELYTLNEESMAVFAGTIHALNLAAQKLAELDPSKTANEWLSSLMKEAADDIAQGEGLEHIADTEVGENLP